MWLTGGVAVPSYVLFVWRPDNVAAVAALAVVAAVSERGSRADSC